MEGSRVYRDPGTCIFFLTYIDNIRWYIDTLTLYLTLDTSLYFCTFAKINHNHRKLSTLNFSLSLSQLSTTTCISQPDNSSNITPSHHSSSTANLPNIFTKRLSVPYSRVANSIGVSKGKYVDLCDIVCRIRFKLL